MSAGEHRFPARLRLSRRDDFSRLLRLAPRSSDATLTVWALPNGRRDTRLGLLVTRRHGGAVSRNAVKRRLREAFRQCRDRLPEGFDVLCSPAVGSRLDVTTAMESLVRLTMRLARRTARP